MSGDTPISWLMFFTLSAGIAVGAGLLISFLRTRHNREIAAYALALLTFGYHARSDWKPTAQNARGETMNSRHPAPIPIRPSHTSHRTRNLTPVRQ
jgi:hypothetical protein